MEQNTVAVFISGGALLVSILSFWVAWKAFDRDRNDFRFSLTFHRRSERGTAFAMRIVNHGRRLIRINLARLHFKGGEIIDHDRLEQVVLRESEDDLLWFPMTFPPSRKEINLLDLRKAEVTDTLGKKYRFPSWSFNSWKRYISLKREISKTPKENDYHEPTE